MKIRNSLKTAKTRHKDCRLVRRKGRLYIINKTNPRFKARQGDPRPAVRQRPRSRMTKGPLNGRANRVGTELVRYAGPCRRRRLRPASRTRRRAGVRLFEPAAVGERLDDAQVGGLGQGVVQHRSEWCCGLEPGDDLAHGGDAAATVISTRATTTMPRPRADLVIDDRIAGGDDRHVVNRRSSA